MLRSRSPLGPPTTVTLTVMSLPGPLPVSYSAAIAFASVSHSSDRNSCCAMLMDSLSFAGSGRGRSAVHRDDRGAAEAEVVLQCDLGTVDLTGFGFAPELPVELRALREPGGPEGVTFRDETAGRVDDPLAAVGDGAL